MPHPAQRDTFFFGSPILKATRRMLHKCTRSQQNQEGNLGILKCTREAKVGRTRTSSEKNNVCINIFQIAQVPTRSSTC